MSNNIFTVLMKFMLYFGLLMHLHKLIFTATTPYRSRECLAVCPWTNQIPLKLFTNPLPFTPSQLWTRTNWSRHSTAKNSKRTSGWAWRSGRKASAEKCWSAPIGTSPCPESHSTARGSATCSWTTCPMTMSMSRARDALLPSKL